MRAAILLFWVAVPRWRTATSDLNETNINTGHHSLIQPTVVNYLGRGIMRTLPLRNHRVSIKRLVVFSFKYWGSLPIGAIYENVVIAN